MRREGFVMYKSQLQEYAQKAGLMHPTYDHVKEGASHEPRFKSTVWVNNQSYESPPGFPTLRSAEHAAAKAALDFLQKTQTSGVVPSPVHESGLCKNLLQEFAQKNGYPLPQYKIMRQGEDHSLVFTATVDIAGVSYSGGGAKSKKEAEIKAARTALLAIQASQPVGAGLPVVEPRPLAQPQPGQITNFVKAHPKRKKRARVNPLEEPLATRMKQCLGPVGGPVQLQQMHQVHQMHEMPRVIHVTQMSQLPQTFPGSTVGYSGQSVMPVAWNQELGVAVRPLVVCSGPIQTTGNFPPQDMSTRGVAAQEIGTTLDTKAAKAGNYLSTATETAVIEAQVTTAKAESVTVEQASLATDNVKGSQTSKGETNMVPKEQTSSLGTTEVNDSQVSQVSGSVTGTTPKTSGSGAPRDSVRAQEPHTLTNGELQAELLRAKNVSKKSASSEAA